MNVLGIIPAKGTSSAVPRKNMAPLCGKPLLWWTLAAALSSKLLYDVIVSTEDEEIADQARRFLYGWRVARIAYEPPHFAAGGGDTLGVLQWNVNQLDVKPDAVMCLQPTCPLRRTEDIDGAIDLMERTGCDSVTSWVSVGANHPDRMAHIDEDGNVEVFTDEMKRRQDLEPTYIRSGDIYLTKREVLEAGRLYGRKRKAWIIPPERACNIDERIDLVLAATRMEYLQCQLST